MAIIFVIKCEKRPIGRKLEEFFKIFFDKIMNYIIIKKRSFIQFSMVSSNGMLIKRLSMSKLAMTQLASKLTTSSANESQSWTVNSLTVKDDKIGTKSFAKL